MLLAIICATLFALVVRPQVAGWFRARRDRVPVQSTTPDFPIDISIAQPAYNRFGLVEITLTLVDANGAARTTGPPPEVLVRDRDGNIVTTVGGVDRLQPRRSPGRSTFVCRWPVPWNAAPGRYVVEAQAPIDDASAWAWVSPSEQEDIRRRRGTEPRTPQPGTAGVCVVMQVFEVVAAPRAELPAGLCAVTWEESFPSGPVERPDGSKGDWRAILDWAEYMGADAFWFRGFVTAAYGPDEALTMTQPWRQDNIAALAALGDEAHRRGLRFGVWAAAMSTLPESSNAYKPPYRWAQDISRSTGRVSDTAFVSLLDENRLAHLAAALSTLEQMPQVDMMGLDYIRPEEHSYELSELFMQEMPVTLPAGWDQLPQPRKWQYVASKVEREWNRASGQDFYDMWTWWRSHRTAEYVGELRRRSQARKPLWIFMLSWMHGKQHGQDPVMFTDAGVSLVCPMLYQADSYEHFEAIIAAWKSYLQAGQVNLAPGDQVDDYWHKKAGTGRKAVRSRRPAAPEVLFERMVRAHSGLVPNGPSLGAFWHDISRAARLGASPDPSSPLGPYPGREWALAGGAAFSAIRDTWRLHPVAARLELPPTTRIGAAFDAIVQVENRSERPVGDIRIELQDTPQIAAVGETARVIERLGPGERISVPFSVKVAAGSAARQNRFMVAARLTWPQGKYGAEFAADLPRVIIVMKYIDATGAQGS